jgi:hypothetical protein
VRVYAVLLSALLAACGATRLYEGPERPSSEVATIRVEYNPDVAGTAGDVSYDVKITGFDGKALTSEVSVVSVLPGRHSVLLRWTRFRVPDNPRTWGNRETTWKYVEDRGEKEMTLDAKAGWTYELVVPAQRAASQEWYFKEHPPR